jgi:chaperonin cofactor prefoldin
MIRLSSRDASLLMDVLEQQELPPEERLKLLDEADPVVRQIGEVLIDQSRISNNPDIKEAVEQIRQWAEETTKIQEKQLLYAYNRF